MVNTKISELGSHVQASAGDEELEPALGDGAAKAGMMCGILSTGKVVAIDANSATLGLTFVGILARLFGIALDTVITDALLCQLMVPSSKRKYKVFIEDPGAAALKGTPLTWGITTAGSLTKITSKAATGLLGRTLVIDDTVDVPEQPIVAYLLKDMANGDTVGWIRWA